LSIATISKLMQQIARIASRRRSLSWGPPSLGAVARSLASGRRSLGAGVRFTPDRFSAISDRYPDSTHQRASEQRRRGKALSAPTIDELTIADEPAHWAALGFDVADGRAQIGAVRLRFAGPAATPRSPGIAGWSLRELASAELDGLPTTISERHMPAPAPTHPNGVLAIDHVVAVSPDLDRSVTAMQAAGLDLRRVREQPTPAGAPRQAFFRLGHEILELIQEPERVATRAGGTDRPVRFWGLALLVEDLDRCAQLLAPHVGEVRPAVQPGRRIATVRRSADLAVPLALMSRDERADEQMSRDERADEQTSRAGERR
jgi:hypothetical protein